MKKAAIYARVNTVDQHIESQLYEHRQLAQQTGLEVVKEYTDKGVSGLKARRPGLDALMADARQRKFSVVLVAAFDRVAHSTKHFSHVMDELDSLGIQFVSDLENIDTSGPMGRLFMTFICAIAELESDLIRDRIREGMRLARLQTSSYRQGTPRYRSPADCAGSPLRDVADAGLEEAQHFACERLSRHERGSRECQPRCSYSYS